MEYPYLNIKGHNHLRTFRRKARRENISVGKEKRMETIRDLTLYSVGRAMIWWNLREKCS